METELLQSEITANTTAITAIQQELIILGIVSVINGVFSFTSQRRLRLRPKSTGSARLRFRLRSTVQNQGMLFLILF